MALKDDRVEQCLRSCGSEFQMWGPKQEKFRTRSTYSAEKMHIRTLDWTREGHRQSDGHCNRSKGDIGETSERRGGEHMGFSERIDTILN